MSAPIPPDDSHGRDIVRTRRRRPDIGGQLYLCDVSRDRSTSTERTPRPLTPKARRALSFLNQSGDCGLTSFELCSEFDDSLREPHLHELWAKGAAVRRFASSANGPAYRYWARSLGSGS